MQHWAVSPIEGLRYAAKDLGFDVYDDDDGRTFWEGLDSARVQMHALFVMERDSFDTKVEFD